MTNETKQDTGAQCPCRKALEEIIDECERSIECFNDESDDDHEEHIENCVGCTIARIAREALSAPCPSEAERDYWKRTFETYALAASKAGYIFSCGKAGYSAEKDEKTACEIAVCRAEDAEAERDMWRDAHDHMNRKAAEAIVECDQLRDEVRELRSKVELLQSERRGLIGLVRAELEESGKGPNRRLLDLSKDVVSELWELHKDKERLDWLDQSNSITSDEANEIVNSHRFKGTIYDSTRAAIDAAMKESQ